VEDIVGAVALLAVGGIEGIHLKGLPMDAAVKHFLGNIVAIPAVDEGKIVVMRKILHFSILVAKNAVNILMYRITQRIQVNKHGNRPSLALSREFLVLMAHHAILVGLGQ